MGCKGSRSMAPNRLSGSASASPSNQSGGRRGIATTATSQWCLRRLDISQGSTLNDESAEVPEPVCWRWASPSLFACAVQQFVRYASSDWFDTFSGSAAAVPHEQHRLGRSCGAIGVPATNGSSDTVCSSTSADSVARSLMIVLRNSSSLVFIDSRCQNSSNSPRLYPDIPAADSSSSSRASMRQLNTKIGQRTRATDKSSVSVSRQVDLPSWAVGRSAIILPDGSLGAAAVKQLSLKSVFIFGDSDWRQPLDKNSLEVLQALAANDTLHLKSVHVLRVPFSEIQTGRLTRYRSFLVLDLPLVPLQSDGMRGQWFRGAAEIISLEDWTAATTPAPTGPDKRSPSPSGTATEEKPLESTRGERTISPAFQLKRRCSLIVGGAASTALLACLQPESHVQFWSTFQPSVAAPKSIWNSIGPPSELLDPLRTAQITTVIAVSLCQSSVTTGPREKKEPQPCSLEVRTLRTWTGWSVRLLAISQIPQTREGIADAARLVLDEACRQEKHPAFDEATTGVLHDHGLLIVDAQQGTTAAPVAAQLLALLGASLEAAIQHVKTKAFISAGAELELLSESARGGSAQDANIEPAPPLSAATFLHQLKSYGEAPESIARTLRTMRNILFRAMDDSHDTTFRSIRMENPKFLQNVSRHSCCLELLEQAGWRRLRGPQEDRLELPAAASMEPLQNLLKIIEAAQDELEREP